VSGYALVLCGMQAAGKSTIAEVLSRNLGVPVVSSDRVRKALYGLSDTDLAPESAYLPAVNTNVYLRLGHLAARRVREDQGVIVDATFRRADDRATFFTAFRAAGPVLFAECQAPLSRLIERARARDALTGQISDATAEVVERAAGSWQPLQPEEVSGGHLLVQTDVWRPDLAAEMIVNHLVGERVS
jgi:predicted kinase